MFNSPSLNIYQCTCFTLCPQWRKLYRLSLIHSTLQPLIPSCHCSCPVGETREEQWPRWSPREDSDWVTSSHRLCPRTYVGTEWLPPPPTLLPPPPFRSLTALLSKAVTCHSGPYLLSPGSWVTSLLQDWTSPSADPLSKWSFSLLMLSVTGPEAQDLEKSQSLKQNKTKS